MRELLDNAAGGRVALRTPRRSEVMTVLAQAGATVAAVDKETITVRGLPSERIVSLLAGNGLPFSEVARHRVSLEEAYMELTRDAVEFNAPVVGEA